MICACELFLCGHEYTVQAIMAAPACSPDSTPAERAVQCTASAKTQQHAPATIKFIVHGARDVKDDMTWGAS